MTSQDLVLRYVTEQMDALCERPEMWGPTFCVELQFLMLMEFWLVTTSPTLAHKHPRLVLEEYHAFCKRHGFDARRPLAEANRPIEEFTGTLRDFRKDFPKRIAPLVLAEFDDEVHDRFPLATTTAAQDLAARRLEIRLGERQLDVEWDPELGFSVVRIPVPEQARSFVLDAQQALQRVGIMLRGAVLTTAERDRLRGLSAPMDPELSDAPDELTSFDDELTEQVVVGVRPDLPPRRARLSGT